MDIPALKFNGSKGKWKQDIFQDPAGQLQALLLLPRTDPLLGVVRDSPKHSSNVRGMQPLSKERCRVLGQSRLFFRNS